MTVRVFQRFFLLPQPPIEKPANETKKESLFEEMFRPSLFLSYAFILVNISTLISSLGYMIPFTFLPGSLLKSKHSSTTWLNFSVTAHAEGLGFDRDEAAFLVSIIGITTCVGPVVGWITDHPKVVWILTHFSGQRMKYIQWIRSVPCGWTTYPWPSAVCWPSFCPCYTRTVFWPFTQQLLDWPFVSCIYVRLTCLPV